MRLLTVSIMVLAATAAAAQSDATAACEARPTRSCVLDMAAEAALAARPEDGLPAPLDDLVKTASQAGRLDLAGALAARIPESGFFRPGFLVEAMARAGRLEGVRGIAARGGHTEGEFADNVAPVLVELGRDAELAALAARLDPPASEARRLYWVVLGNLRAGRAGTALDRLGAAAPEDRAAAAAVVLATLTATASLKLAVPLLPLIPAEDPRDIGLRAEIAEAAGDLALARSLVPAVEALPPEDRRQAAEKLASALAASGAWREAVAFAETNIPAGERLYALAQIAVASRDPGALTPFEAGIEAEPDADARGSATEFLIRAMILSGDAAGADRLVDGADTEQERWWRVRLAASALAQAGNGAKAMQMARSFADPAARAWVLAGITANLRD